MSRGADGEGDGAGGAQLRLEDVTTFYGQMRILDSVSLEVHPGELVCLLGGNASGKSTTLKTTLGLVRPRAGRVVLGGEDVTGRPPSARIVRGAELYPDGPRALPPELGG